MAYGKTYIALVPNSVNEFEGNWAFHLVETRIPLVYANHQKVCAHSHWHSQGIAIISSVFIFT